MELRTLFSVAEATLSLNETQFGDAVVTPEQQVAARFIVGRVA